jgi:hypothetical protein
MAIGAWVELRAGGLLQRHEVTIGGGHGSGMLGPVHFGLGEATTAEARVIWPDGSVTDWQAVLAGRATTLTKR